MPGDLISIIVPIYNTEQYLQECIDSLLKQTYPRIEIVLVNDGSSDQSLEISIRNAKQNRNIKIINQKNKGVSAARNRGILESQGDYLTFVDSDDVLCMDAVSVMYEMITRHDADIVSAAMTKNASYIPIGEDTYDILSDQQTAERVLNEVSTSACAKLYSKKAIKGILFEEGKNINEDGFFVFECYLRQLKVIETDKVVYLYRTRQGSASRSMFSEKYLDMLYFLEKKKKIIEEQYPQYKERMLKLEIRTNLNMLQLLCSNRDKKYIAVERKCCEFIRKQKNPDKKDFSRYEKRVYSAVHLRVYWLYKVAIRILKK